MTWAAVTFLAFVAICSMANEERYHRRDNSRPLWPVLAVLSVLGIILLVAFR